MLPAATAAHALLARDSGRPGRRATGLLRAIAGYPGCGATFDRALVDFAERYADQTERDHRALVDAIESGRIHTGI